MTVLFMRAIATASFRVQRSTDVTTWWKFLAKISYNVLDLGKHPTGSYEITQGTNFLLKSYWHSINSKVTGAVSGNNASWLRMSLSLSSERKI